jgi:hypothetical protein
MKNGTATLYEFFCFTRGVVLSTQLSAEQKLILMGIRLHANHDDLGGAHPSYETLARCASVKDPRTIRKELAPLVSRDGILTRQERPGRTPIYGIVSPKLQQLLDAYGIVPPKVQEPPVAMGEVDRRQPPTRHEGGNEVYPLHAMRGGEGAPPSCHVPRPLKKKEQGFAECGHADASMQGSAELERVSLREGVLTLAPDLRAIWLPKFGNDAESLDFALTETVAYIQPNSLKSLEVQVSAQLARRAREARERQQRYEARAGATKRNGSAGGIFSTSKSRSF